MHFYEGHLIIIIILNVFNICTPGGKFQHITSTRGNLKLSLRTSHFRVVFDLGG